MDPISDMMNRIKNAQAVDHERVSIPFSNVKLQIAQILSDAGFVAGFERTKKKAKRAELDYIEVVLKYNAGEGAISGLRIISRPSRHIYIKASEIKPVRSGYGSAIVSTSQGIMTSQAARKAGLGGEVLFEIW
ncbi:MAG: 30S ribosomal protein S8 [Candidatus Pacebacteria bacterium]|nr:30S ribosomal protein S8 [Candidatus Paceibacterota bacterium]